MAKVRSILSRSPSAARDRQGAMGWLDYHLHEFRLTDPSGTLVFIGIPTDEESPERPSCLAGTFASPASSSAPGGTHRQPCTPTTSVTTGSTQSCTREC